MGISALQAMRMKKRNQQQAEEKPADEGGILKQEEQHNGGNKETQNTGKEEKKAPETDELPTASSSENISIEDNDNLPDASEAAGDSQNVSTEDASSVSGTNIEDVPSETQQKDKETVSNSSEDQSQEAPLTLEDVDQAINLYEARLDGFKKQKQDYITNDELKQAVECKEQIDTIQKNLEECRQKRMELEEQGKEEEDIKQNQEIKEKEKQEKADDLDDGYVPIDGKKRCEYVNRDRKRCVKEAGHTTRHYYNPNGGVSVVVPKEEALSSQEDQPQEEQPHQEEESSPTQEEKPVEKEQKIEKEQKSEDSFEEKPVMDPQGEDLTSAEPAIQHQGREAINAEDKTLYEDRSPDVKTQGGKIRTSKVYPNYSSQSEEEQQEIEVNHFLTEPAKISCSKGRTVNLGNYESARVDVHVTLPTYVEEIEDAYQQARSLIDEKISEEVEKITNTEEGDTL